MPSFEPPCTHITVSRVYGPDKVYGACQRPGPLGWVYQCTQDLEEPIERSFNIRSWAPTHDPLSESLAVACNLNHANSPRNDDRFAILENMSPRTLSTYRPDQLATVLRQREEVQAAIHRQLSRQRGDELLTTDTATIRTHRQRPCPDNPSLWRASRPNCQYRVCPRCRPAIRGRAMLSLNSVAQGHALPSAAAGFGFEDIGGRPVTDAKLVKRFRPGIKLESNATSLLSISVPSLLQILEKEIADGHSILKATASTPEELLSSTSSFTHGPGKLKHSPGCDNLGNIAKIEADSKKKREQDEAAVLRSCASSPVLKYSTSSCRVDALKSRLPSTWHKGMMKELERLTLPHAKQGHTTLMTEFITQA